MRPGWNLIGGRVEVAVEGSPEEAMIRHASVSHRKASSQERRDSRSKPSDAGVSHSFLIEGEALRMLKRRRLGYRATSAITGEVLAEELITEAHVTFMFVDEEDRDPAQALETELRPHTVRWWIRFHVPGSFGDAHEVQITWWVPKD